MEKYLYVNNEFLPSSIKDLWISAGMWDEGKGVFVSEDVFLNFPKTKDGKIRTTGQDGYPIFSDPAPLANAEALSTALSSLATAYKNDSYALNMAYVAAVANDGSTEAAKVTSVRSKITARKSQYISDIAAAKAKYPLE